MPRPPAAQIATMREVSACRRGAAVSTVASDRPIRPIRLRGPVAVAVARPRPRVTIAPENTSGRSSPPGSAAQRSSGPAARLRTGTDSPVSRASSASRSRASSTRASAATRSPCSSTSRSPATTSGPGIRTVSPSRMTSALGADRSRRASSTVSVRASCTMVMTIESTAKSSMASIGSRSTSRAIRHGVRRAARGSSFGPSRARISCACRWLSPVSVRPVSNGLPVGEAAGEPSASGMGRSPGRQGVRMTGETGPCNRPVDPSAGPVPPPCARTTDFDPYHCPQ